MVRIVIIARVRYGSDGYRVPGMPNLAQTKNADPAFYTSTDLGPGHLVIVRKDHEAAEKVRFVLYVS